MVVTPRRFVDGRGWFAETWNRASLLTEEPYYNSEVVRDRDAFLKRADLIVSNRLEDALLSVKYKILTRDLFGVNELCGP